MRASLTARIGQKKLHESQTPQPRCHSPVATGFSEGVQIIRKLRIAEQLLNQGQAVADVCRAIGSCRKTVAGCGAPAWMRTPSKSSSPSNCRSTARSWLPVVAQQAWRRGFHRLQPMLTAPARCPMTDFESALSCHVRASSYL